MDLFAIAGLWVGVFLIGSIAVMDGGSRLIELAWCLVALGFLAHVTGYVLLKSRRARQK
jgi:hypothetical protein